MTDIENNAVSFGDGAVVQELRLDEIKKPVSIGTSVRQTVQEFVSDHNFSLCYRHVRKPPARPRPTLRFSVKMPLFAERLRLLPLFSIQKAVLPMSSPGPGHGLHVNDFERLALRT